MGAAAYVRVSSSGQSVAGQRAELERWLAANGLVATWYVDHGASGDSLERPAFDQLRKAVQAGAVSTVVVHRLDRLSRSLVDGLTLLADWCRRDVRVVAITQQIDLSGTVGQLLAAVLLGLAQMEQEARRERQAAGIAAAKAAGVYRGGMPGRRKASTVKACDLRGRGLAVADVARTLGVSRATAYRYLRTSPEPAGA